MKRTNQGFTLVELMLAMVFVSGLLLAIALLTMQVVNIYTKGVTLSAVDQAGQILSREIQDQLAAAPSDNVKIIANSGDDGGRLCTGQISYAWNFGDAINDPSNARTVNKYQDGTKDIRFIKVTDPGASLCASKTATAPGNISSQINKAASTELLASTDRNIALRQLTFSQHALDTSAQTLYSISAVIATNNQDELITGQTQCKPPIEGFSEFCAVNKFDFNVRASNTEGGS